MAASCWPRTHQSHKTTRQRPRHGPAEPARTSCQLPGVWFEGRKYCHSVHIGPILDAFTRYEDLSFRHPGRDCQTRCHRPPFSPRSRWRYSMARPPRRSPDRAARHLRALAHGRKLCTHARAVMAWDPNAVLLAEAAVRVSNPGCGRHTIAAGDCRETLGPARRCRLR